MRTIICFIAVFFIINSSSVFAQSDNVVKYETKEYKIIFPGQPKRITQDVPSVFGPLFMTIAMFEPSANNDNYIYMIAETDYPDSSIHSDKTEILDKYFREAIEGAVKNVNGELIKEVPGHVGKYPSRLIEIDYKKGTCCYKISVYLM
jgi:hypothetical protein